MAEIKLIAEFEKGSNEVVRVSISEYHGQKYLDLRCWYHPHAQSLDDEMLPTKKGICLHTEMIPDLQKAIKAAAAYICSMYASKVADPVEPVESPEETPGSEGQR